MAKVIIPSAGINVPCAIGCVVDVINAMVRISFINQDDKAFGYVEYTFGEMPILADRDAGS